MTIITMLLSLLLMSWTTMATEMESSNYYTKRYLFDAQNYANDVFVTDTTISHTINSFTPHGNFIQYQGLDKYQESDFGLGIEYSLNDKWMIDVGSWYYYYYTAGDHYFEPYISLSYDWIVSPMIYLSMITYNNTPRAVLSFDYTNQLTDHLQVLFTPVVGTADYNDRYGYCGIISQLNYKLNTHFTCFTSFEIDKPFDAVYNNLINTYTIGFKLSF